MTTQGNEVGPLVASSSSQNFSRNVVGPSPMRPAQRPEALRASVVDSLRILEREQIPVVNLRRPEDRARMPLLSEQTVPSGDQLAAMTATREDGVRRARSLVCGEWPSALPAP